jgi:hypothetical protein
MIRELRIRYHDRQSGRGGIAGRHACRRADQAQSVAVFAGIWIATADPNML